MHRGSTGYHHKWIIAQTCRLISIMCGGLMVDQADFKGRNIFRGLAGLRQYYAPEALKGSGHMHQVAYVKTGTLMTEGPKHTLKRVGKKTQSDMRLPLNSA